MVPLFSDRLPSPRGAAARYAAARGAAARALLLVLSLTGCASARPDTAAPDGAATRPVAAVAPAPARTRVVYVVRHAERADTTRDPSLSEPGRARADALAAALADAGIGSVVTTQYARSRETAAPLARALGIEPVVVAATGPVDAHAADVARAARDASRSGAVLVVGHSNTVPAIVGALGGPRFADLCDADYDNLFVVVLREGEPSRLARTRFGAPDDESGCGAMRPL